MHDPYPGLINFTSIMRLTQAWHRRVFITCVSLVAIGLPLSNALMSIGGLGLALNWFVEGGLKNKVRNFFDQPSAILLVSVFLLYSAGLLWTEPQNLDEGLKSLRIVLPLLLFPVVFSTVNPLSRKEFLWVCAVFIIGVLIGAVAGSFKYWEIKDIPGHDFRAVSVFISHIRFSLMICLAVLMLVAGASYIGKFWPLFLVIALSLGSFLVMALQAFTGMLVLFLLGIAALFWTTARIRKTSVRTIAIAALLLVPLATVIWLMQKIDSFYPETPTDYSLLETYTERGGVYDHHPERTGFENGHPIWTYVCYEELEEAWSLRSEIPFFGGKDAKGQYVYTTIIRFLASKGERKDYVALMNLTDNEITLIEKGVANQRFQHGGPIDNRVYQVLWELTSYWNGQRIDGNSVVQRLEYWKTGWEIWKGHFLIGVGTGDVKQAFAEQYERDQSILSSGWRLLAHNQYLTMGLTFGLPGLLLFISALVWPVIALKHARSAFYLGFLFIAAMSMFGEDTLNTQAGVTFFAFFNAFFLFAAKNQLPDMARTSR